MVSFSGSGITVNSVALVNSTTLTVNVTVGAGAATVFSDVTVNNPDFGIGTGASKFFVSAAPTVSLISPNQLPTGATGQQVVITGTGFQGLATVAISGTNVTVGSLTVDSATQITAFITVAPGATVGARNLTVTNPDFGAVTVTNGFTVIAGPTITGLTPAGIGQGTLNQTITVNGTGFQSGAAVTLLLDLPFLAIFLAVMLYYSLFLSLITLAILGAIVLLSLAVVPFIRERVNAQFLHGARNQAFVTEYIAGMETVKSLQMEPQLRAKYADYLASYLRASFATRQLSNTYNAAANALEQLLTLLILVVGAWIVMKNEGFTIGMLVAFQMFAGRMSQPLLRLVGLWQEFQQAAIAVKRLGDIMNAPGEPYSVIPASDNAGRGSVELVDLSFRYGDNRPYLYQHFNLVLQPGACVALMGPSGSGKSTLAKLLQGFYAPTAGQIKIDGRDIRHLSTNELRSTFGVVPQETVLFSGSVYENLLSANPYATFEQIAQACRWAEIHDTIEQLPQGYQQHIGEHGAGLSGGQKQRLAIARALLKRPKILIFDEAASSLDRPTAEQFARTINQLKGKVTILFITHQLPEGLAVDEIVRLGMGEAP